MNTNAISLNDICTKQQFLEENHEILPRYRGEWIFRKRNENGLSKSGAVLEVQGRLYVVRPKFLEWFVSNNES